jgi:hypothetical protein
MLIFLNFQDAFSALVFAIIIQSIFVLSVSGIHLHCNDVGDTTCSFTLGIVVNVVVFTFRVSEIVAHVMCYLF